MVILSTCVVIVSGQRRRMLYLVMIVNTSRSSQEDEDAGMDNAVDVTGIEAVSCLPTPAVPPPGKEIKSEGASSEQKGKLNCAPVIIMSQWECSYSGSVGGEVIGAESADKEEEEVPVDESLFMEQGDDPINQDDSAAVEDEVPVDESLFDIENLDIDDPSVTKTQDET